MDWRKQIQEHLRDAEEVAIRVVTALSADSHRDRDNAFLWLSQPGQDRPAAIDAAFERVEQRVKNARELWEAHRRRAHQAERKIESIRQQLGASDG